MCRSACVCAHTRVPCLEYLHRIDSLGVYRVSTRNPFPLGFEDNVLLYYCPYSCMSKEPEAVLILYPSVSSTSAGIRIIQGLLEARLVSPPAGFPFRSGWSLGICTLPGCLVKCRILLGAPLGEPLAILTADLLFSTFLSELLFTSGILKTHCNVPLCRF